ncbi:hypothetical protein GCM10009091_43800 [Pseudomonas brenneri]|uniref:PilZ domain-containing protein n=1 Tax=Pseudomonas brenneri TaxID=129817 RepID=A0A5B2UNV3_9PSED|nr:hypothetical protein [Pseudomonas brenneri]KAA2227545.1 hypothetical protein F1720_21925 [Pseudomonas brenneri]TWR75278.1 hypothetical protein FJD34_24110 [Pseudomonas brenneri]GGL57557.1 hypothetical protein GCM10009091_43800 [Pseudomonas brenneri]SDV12358.1 hypothetical protein SAMN04490181_5367 [Pseudomonas brenneri]
MKSNELPTEISCEVDLTLTYGIAPGLGRQAKYSAQPILICRELGKKTSVQVANLGVDLLKSPAISHAQIVLPDGTSLSGAVTKISPCGTYFEMIEDKGARAKDQRPDV